MDSDRTTTLVEPTRRPERSAGDLVRILLNRNSEVPNFALLAGAGASVSSGVRPGKEMIDDWRHSLYTASRSTESFADWLAEQAWFEEEDEYSLLFERTYDLPSQRRVFIEECVKDAHPGWGYVYLTSLLARKIFNVVLTTNFDDLINEACYLYSERLRPMVAAHDSSIGALRMSSDRPKIIKLHGDFLYDNIKNTLSELETLEANTKNKLTQVAQESGLVVVGYGGRDRSVMDVLEVLLRSDHYFPHGVYWCVQSAHRLSKRLTSLLRRDRIHLVQIDGFDELMASIHGDANFDLPSPLAAPLKVAADRAKLFVAIPAELKAHPVIGRDMKCVLREMDRATVANHVPPLLQAAIAEDKGDVEMAIRLWKGELEKKPNDAAVLGELAPKLLRLGRKDEVIEIVSQAPDTFFNKTFLLLRASDFEGVVRFATIRLEKTPRDWVARINRAIALKRLGRHQEKEMDLDVITADLPAEPYKELIAAGLDAVREDLSGLVVSLPDAIEKGYLSRESFRDFPVFDEVRSHPLVIAVAETAFNKREAVLESDRRKGWTREPGDKGVAPGGGLLSGDGTVTERTQVPETLPASTVGASTQPGQAALSAPPPSEPSAGV